MANVEKVGNVQLPDPHVKLGGLANIEVDELTKPMGVDADIPQSEVSVE